MWNCNWQILVLFMFIICMNKSTTGMAALSSRECFSSGANYMSEYTTITNNVSMDEFALLAFKNHITSDPYNVLTENWTQGTPFCHWRGVTCGRKHHRVTSLRLISMNLTGTIAKEISNLSFLVSLEFPNNRFRGEIPEELGNLRRLKHLSFRNNQLSGRIPPSFGSSLNSLQIIDLSANKLQGTIPFTIFNISSLVAIDLSINQLQGTLKKDICSNLPRLQELFMMSNQLGGEIPLLEKCSQIRLINLSQNRFTGSVSRGIGNLSALQQIHLGWNNLTGSLPVEIGNAPSLQRLSFRQNNLVGVIPPSLGNISTLEMLDIGRNNFRGYIPSELGHLQSLQELYLNFNNLHGEIPPSIFNMSKLRVLSLPGNNISGSLPSDMTRGLPNLQGIYLGYNRITGPIPSSISNGSQLRTIALGYNLISGNIPTNLGDLLQLQTLILEVNQLTNDPTKVELEFLTSLTKCLNLTTIQIGHNRLNATLPKSLGNMSSSLGKFHASSSGISGVIPMEIGNLTNLFWLSLAGNKFTGQLPDTIGQLRMLQRLRIYENSGIRGRIPSSLCNLENLYEVNLSKNKLSGEILSCIGNISSLRELYLDSNALTSSLPSGFWNNKGLLVLNLSSNFLDGTLSEVIGSIRGMTSLYLSGNNFSGKIPTTIAQLQNLEILSLSKNRLDGPIPQRIGDITSLAYLDLSLNRISGNIPQSLEKLIYLVYLNLSFNDLSGEIPHGGPFENFSAKAFIGNNALCGASRFRVKECQNENSRKQGNGKYLKYVLPAASAVLIMIVGTVIIWRKRSGSKTRISNADQVHLELTKRFSYLEILNATNNFDIVTLIGQGGFGSVYKGTFSSGDTAAIKIFNLEVETAFKSFDTECEILRTIRHRNLVKVISSCSNLDFKAIVLEYMANGSLEKWLYSTEYSLDIAQRLTVVIDVASALEYLHHGYSFPVVHCDLKPNNILLDEDMVARLGDFGISKLFGEDKMMVQTKTLGTVGYMAPEYGSAGLVSPMADVYSFGILMMEIFVGKRPTDVEFTEDLSMRKWVLESIPDQILEVVDAKLLDMIGENEFVAKRSFFTAVMKLAVDCTQDFPEDRISMDSVLRRLQRVEAQFHQNAETYTYS